MIAATLWNPALVLNALARTLAYDVAADVAYADDPYGRLDVYQPRRAQDASGHNAPVIVFFHGGSWQTGAKETYRFLAATLAARGYVVIVPNYRLYPEVRFPGFREDGAKAVRWVHDNAARYGGDPARIVLMGHSAGAHIAAMLAINDEWPTHEGLAPTRNIAGLIGVSGPYDFLPLKDDTLKAIFGGDRPETQPITYAEGRKPPALLITGADDRTVQPGNSLRLARKLHDHGNEAKAVVYRHFDHLTILLGLAPYAAPHLPLIADIGAFMARIPNSRAPVNAELLPP